MSSESEKLLASLHSKLSLLSEDEKSRFLAQLKAKVGTQKETSSGTLSHAQLRVWMLDQLSECPYLYHVPLVIALHNACDLAKLNSALSLLVQENPVLSSYFLFENEQITQAQAKDCDFELQTIVLDEELAHFFEISESSPLANFFLDSMDTSKAPLFRVAHLKTPMHTRLLICFHHLIVDGWSIPLIVERLNYYCHLVNEPTSAIPALKAQCWQGLPAQSLSQTRIKPSMALSTCVLHVEGLRKRLGRQPLQARSQNRAGIAESTLDLIPSPNTSYLDFIEWEQQNHTIKSRERIEYWLNRLASTSFIVDLPTDYPRPVVKTNRGKTLFKSMPNELVLSLQRFASEQRVSINHLVLCAYQLMLSRYSGQDEITVGIPVTGREHSSWYKTIGLFVNTCLHSISIDNQRTISEQLNQVKQHFLNDMAHADEPFDEVIKALYARQQGIPTQVFNSLYNFIQLKKPNATTYLGLADNYCALPVSKFDVSLHVYASESTMDLLVEYSTELFQEETIDYMFDYLMQILKTMPSYYQSTLSQWIWAMSGETTAEVMV